MAGFLYELQVKLPFAVVAAAYGISILAAAAYWYQNRKNN